MAVIDEILSILANSKHINELTTASSIPANSWFVFYNPITGKAEKISSSVVTSGGWVWIEGSNVEKLAGNNSIVTLEIGDIVWGKAITNSGDPITLMGFTYIGGDKQLATSYQQNQSITT